MAYVRGGAQFDIKLEGADELEAQFARLGIKFPKKHLTRAAKIGISDSYNEAKQSAPVGKNTKTKGTLKRSISLLQETPNKRNKGVYRIRYNPKFSEVFRKKAKNPGIYGGESPAYYPASVEYGYKGKKGHVSPRTEFWLSTLLRRNTGSSLQKVVNSLHKSIDELL